MILFLAKFRFKNVRALWRRSWKHVFQLISVTYLVQPSHWISRLVTNNIWLSMEYFPAFWSGSRGTKILENSKNRGPKILSIRTWPRVLTTSNLFIKRQPDWGRLEIFFNFWIFDILKRTLNFSKYFLDLWKTNPNPKFE